MTSAPEVVVVGAGPAGTLVARSLALRGRSVLLVERTPLPRWKVCGCCLGARGVEVLAREGLADLLPALAPNRPATLALRTREARASLPLEGTAVISRTRLDAALLGAAQAAGVQTLMGWSATLGPWRDGCRQVRLRRGGETRQLAPRIVVSATGLTPLPALSGVSAPEVRVHGDSRIGVGAVFDAGAAAPLAPDPGTVHMCVTPDGYLGMSTLEDGALDLAGALEPQAVRRAGGISAAVGELLDHVGLPAPAGQPRHGWKGTPALTRSLAQPGCEGLFAVGDAAGYVEPFTGEGMTWALSSAEALASRVDEAARRGWQPGDLTRWSHARRRTLGSRALIRAVAWLTRNPLPARLALSLLAAAPILGRPLVRHAAGGGRTLRHLSHDAST